MNYEICFPRDIQPNVNIVRRMEIWSATLIVYLTLFNPYIPAKFYMYEYKLYKLIFVSFLSVL